MKKIDIYDAQHPLRQKAIKIIEQVIEPFTGGRTIKGEKYYNLEDKITLILANKKI